MKNLFLNTMVVLFIGFIIWLIIFSVLEHIRHSQTILDVRCYAGSQQIFNGRAKKTDIRNLFSGGVTFTNLENGNVIRVDGPCVFEHSSKPR
jgi:hypothetical protein